MGSGLDLAKDPKEFDSLNRLALGTAQLGLPYGIANQTGQVSRLTANAMLQLALIEGIDTLDTAMAYGESEECLGSVGTQGFKLVTKLPALPEDCEDVRAWVREKVAQSFFRLGVDSIYGLLLHRPEQLLGSMGKELYCALSALKDKGQVEKVGVSIYSPDELAALTISYRLDLVQAPLNLVDRRLQNTGGMRRLKDQGVEVHTRSAFLQGLLLMSHHTIPIQFAQWNGLWHHWHQWLADNRVSALQACLSFPLSFPEIDRVVVGADSVDHLAQIIRATTSQPSIDLPDLQCDNENLINPGYWSKA
jgi:aryl-alcohol dehydrogenase-like predicted oxidoreductase